MDFKTILKKGIYKLLFVIGICCILFSCQKIEVLEHQAQSKTFSLSLLAQPVSEQTKAAYMGLEFGWEAGDIAAIIAPNNLYTPLMLDSLSAGKKLGAFKGTLNGWEGEKEIYVVYPWTSDGKDRINLANKSYNFSLSEIQSSADQTRNNKDNARYSLMLGKTTASPANSFNIELFQMMSFIDFKISKAGNYTVREIQIECNDSVFCKSGTFNLSDFSFAPGKKTKKISLVNNISYQPGDITLAITLFPINLSSTGLNKEIYVDVIAVDNTSGKLMSFRFNKGAPAKAYEKNTRYLASLDLSTLTPIPYQNEFYVSQQVQNLSNLESTFPVDINTNGQKWSSSEIPDWLSLSQQSGGTSSNITVMVKANTHFLPRTGTITFTAGTEKRTLIINQALNPEVAGDKAALEAFFAAAGGENWTNKANWLSDKPLNEWSYITTDSETGRVNSIEVELGNLKGYLSEEVYKLSELKKLSIFTMEPGTFKIALTSKVNNLSKLEMLHLVYVSNDMPNEIFDLTQLKHLVIVSNPIYNAKILGNVRFENLKNLEYLQVSEFEMGTGFPMGILTLQNLGYLQLGLSNRNNNQIEVPEQIYSLNRLTEIRLYLGYTLRLSPKINNLSDLEVFVCGNPTGVLVSELYNLTKLRGISLGNGISQHNLTGILSPEIGKLKNLTEFEVIRCNLEGTIPKEIGGLPLITFVCMGNKLSGKIPLEVKSHPNWEKWSPSRWILPQQDGFVLEIDKYISTDFSEDGKIAKLHTATKGRGINIVVLGDGFVDYEVEPGKIYDITMTKFKESFIAIEPFKTYKDYFNIFMVKTVSKEQGISSNDYLINNKFETIAKLGSYPTYNYQKILQFLDSLGLDDSFVTLIANSYSIHANTAFFPDNNSGKVKTCAMLGVNTGTYGINHESGGHGIGLLADEYMRSAPETIPSEEITITKQLQHNFNMYTNIDFTSDLSKIRWAHMVNHPKYKGIVGAYEGGLYYFKGVWRAESQSIMGYFVGLNYFNAPSREAIVKQIKEQAGETYSFEDFVANDKIEYPDGWLKSSFIPDKNYKHYPPRVIIND